ncbi:hypothetical protein KP509_01G046300 [Ceratopteris richardii]|uniref:Uncharacterized protein n=1 Tax=Ceratopteris richardii TaxID=49495 RepID=A0A8T2VCM3_CERRI|nr:hypothetical protein KP509_01G046300 [Ceratopteris richardii]
MSETNADTQHVCDQQVLTMAGTTRSAVSFMNQILSCLLNERPAFTTRASTTRAAAIRLSLSKKSLMQGTQNVERLQIIRRLQCRQTLLSSDMDCARQNEGTTTIVKDNV